MSEMFGFGRYGGGRMRGLGQYIDAVHSRLAPFKHWFLQAIGVGPQFQGRGYASKLLMPMLSRIDKKICHAILRRWKHKTFGSMSTSALK
ncbi:GNAT family N-acetyltransferase [Chloroflexota bacterium]